MGYGATGLHEASEEYLQFLANKGQNEDSPKKTKLACKSCRNEVPINTGIESRKRKQLLLVNDCNLQCLICDQCVMKSIKEKVKKDPKLISSWMVVRCTCKREEGGKP